MPPVQVLAAVALIAALIGFLADRAERADHGGALRLTGQLAVVQFLGHVTVYLALGQPSNGCLPALGRGAALGVRLAILREDPRCAPGEYATGPVTTTATAVLLTGAAVLLWQFLVAACGSALLQTTQQAWATVVALLAAAVLVVREFSALVTTGPVPRPFDEPRPRLESAVISALLQRGPPAAAAA
jgi:hypothetical protein